VHPLLLFFLAIGTLGWAKRRRALAAAALIGLFLVAWPPVAWLVARPLESRYSAHLPTAAGAEAIVILAAGAVAQKGELPAALKEDTYLRCRHALLVWKRNPQLPVLSCGGSNSRMNTSVAAMMRRMLADEGVPETLLWSEDRSTSTYENALYGAQILRQKGVRRIVLVTEAYHMLRSERCFRKQGIDVIPAACNFNSLEPEVNSFLPDASGLLENEQTLHELIGLSWYFVRGRI
jgi:uncharacterized SAM-binding protein YcdF (DUF218 family)